MTLFHGRKFFEAHERKPAEQMNSCNTSNTDLGFLSTFLLLIFPPHSLPNSPIHIFIHSFIQSHVNTSVTDFRFLSFRLFFVPSFSFLSSLHPIHSTTHFSNSRPDHLHPGLWQVGKEKTTLFLTCTGVPRGDDRPGAGGTPAAKPGTCGRGRWCRATRPRPFPASSLPSAGGCYPSPPSWAPRWPGGCGTGPEHPVTTTTTTAHVVLHQMTWFTVVWRTQNLRWDGSKFQWHQPRQCCKDTTSVDV